MERGTFHYADPFPLEYGDVLPGFEIAYATAGFSKQSTKPIVWVCHAFSGHPEVDRWWPELFGAGKFFDPAHFQIICANMPGSCYGSTGPLSVNPQTGNVWYRSFPLLTNRDMVRMFDILRQHLEIGHIEVLLGGSMGGQHVLEWSILRPTIFRQIIPIATNAWHSPWAIAFNETQRMAIEADPTFFDDHEQGGLSGMSTARAIAMLSYRSYEGYQLRQAETELDKWNQFKAASYQRYQGKKFTSRFNAYTYWYLSKAMDSQQVGRGRGSVEEALQSIQAKALIIGMTGDLLFPYEEQAFLAKHIPHAQLVGIDSPFGHDGFLVEIEALTEAFRNFLYLPSQA